MDRGLLIGADYELGRRSRDTEVTFLQARLSQGSHRPQAEEKTGREVFQDLYDNRKPGEIESMILRKVEILIDFTPT